MHILSHLFSLTRTISISLVVLLPFFSLLVSAQSTTCVTISGGCDLGGAGDAALQAAIQRFDPGLFYGGGDDAKIISTALVNEVLAEIGYECDASTGAIPPKEAGLNVQAQLKNIASCPNQCGTFIVSGTCGFSVLIFSGVTGAVADANRDVIDVIPNGSCCTSVPTNDEILAIIQSLEDQFRDLEDLAEQWLAAIQAGETRRKDKRSGVATGFQMSLNSGFVRLRSRSETVEEEFEMVAMNGGQVAQQQLPNVRNLVQMITTLQAAVAAALPTDAAAVQAILTGAGAGVVSFAVLFGIFTIIISAVSGSTGGGGGTTTPTSTPTSTTTSAISTASVCEPCSARNAAAAQATTIITNPLKKRDVFFGLPQWEDISERSLEKRAGRIFTSQSIGSYGTSFGKFQTGLNFCPNNIFTWHALKYPSTSSAPNQTPINATGGDENTNDGMDDPNAGTSTSAPDIQGIGSFSNGQFIDLQYSYVFNSPNDNNGLQVYICGSTISGFPNRFASSNDHNYFLATGNAPEQNYYDTEHVFELHMVKDFFVWLFQDQGLTCQALQNIWGIDGNGVDNNANLLMQQLAWYDPVTGQGTLSELFVLNRGLNQLKGAFMNGRPLEEIENVNQVLPRPTSFFECLDFLQSSMGVMGFLNNPGPRQAFINSRNRVRSFLSDGTQFNSINEGLPAGATWAGLWNSWMTAWINKRQNDVNAWRVELKNTCRNLVNDPCWATGYDTLYEQAFPTAAFQFPLEWFP